MPIVFDETERVFHISGKSFSYCLRLDERGEILNLYWGAPLPRGGVGYLAESFRDGASFDLRRGRLPLEIPTRGAGWYGTPTVRAINERGDDMTCLRYVSHSITRGKPPLEGLPATYAQDDSEATTLTLTLRDDLTGLEALAEYTVFETLDAMTRSIRLTNGGSSALRLTHMLSASVPFFGGEYDLVHLNGAWARERAVKRETVGQAVLRIESQRGASGHEENPWVCLVGGDTGEFSGEAWAFSLVYSGSFLAEARVNNNGDTRVSIGLNPETCQWRLEPGASFQTPEAVLVYSTDGLNGVSHIYHTLYRTRLCRGVWRDKPRPILINNWEATYFQFNEAKILDIVTRAKAIGVELMVLDDGWFGKRDTDNCSLGDWVVDRKKLPDGVDGLARKVNEAGMLFGLWFEPEMVSPDSDLYRAHPDWCLHAEGRPRTEARRQLILDLSRPDVQDYIVESICATLQRAPIAYVKWDMNRNMTEPFSTSQSPERQFETQHRYMLGLYRVLEAITSRFPNVLFESCSGGGGRFDPGILHYMPQTWTSDDTDPVERLKIQYGTSYAYPPSSICAHVSASPNHQTGRSTSMKMRCDAALGWNFGFELDLGKLDPDDLDVTRDQVERVKELRGFFQTARFTRLQSPFDSQAISDAAWQWVSEDRRKVVLCAFQPVVRPNPAPRRVKLKGLNADNLYREQGGGRVFDGAALMYAGFVPTPAQGDADSQVYIFEAE
ncbi:MAG: alpha-galactosidase [Oscillospiraceae bacterium]|jgi:alpha-galactosidase|nr:alpha-galactosidase [Oscillospiraceae bacterium]